MAGDLSHRRHRRRRLGLVLAGGVAVLVLYAIVSSGGPAPAPPAPTPPIPVLPIPAPPAAWLGLNYNSNARPGAVSDFARRGIVYDREGNLEVQAGQTPESAPWFAVGLDIAYAARMIPDVQVDANTGPPGCENNPTHSKTCLPTTETEISSLVRGFVQTAASVVHAYPGKLVLFEPLDEPWEWASPPGTPPDKAAAKEYAAILARLLPAAAAAAVPLSDIYVPALGKLSDGSSWISDLYAAQPCLKPGPASCGPIAGWSLHPYGLPHSATEGIESVPRVRSGMRSGRDNVVVSEIGFCAKDVAGGSGCADNQPDVDGTNSQTAAWLTETLHEAAAMHRAGWLKALLVWERAGTGWAMQNPDGTLTAQGRALDLFADSPAGR